MIAHESNSDRASETDGDDRDTRRRSPTARLTNLELRVGTLKLPPMWEIKGLAVKLRLAPASGPYSTAFRLLVLFAVLLVVLVVLALP
jgi:hypothetical protein